MKNKITLFLIFILSMHIHIIAQSAIDSILFEIGRNNKTIQATTQYYASQNLQFRTGIHLPDPVVEYDFLKGSPANAGNQNDLTITQQFDFPTTYFKKSQLATTYSAQTEYLRIAERQDVLLQAKKYCIDLVYRNKLQLKLLQQKQNTEKLLQNYQTRLDKGDGNILDVNKAKLQLLELKSRAQQNIAEIEQLQTHLTALNGGIPVVFTDTMYNTIHQVPTFEQLENEYEQADPIIQILLHDKNISEAQTELSKAMWLPKFELGYHYQGILGQSYNGIHTGISIPIWENKNTVQYQQAKSIYADFALEEHITEHFHHVKALYERYINLKIVLDEYRSIFSNNYSITILDKALALGEITTIEYFNEANHYQLAYNNFLQTEREYYLTLAELFKYRL